MADRRVELIQAFAWTCEDCGRDNFARAVAVEGADAKELQQQMRDDLGLMDFEPIPDGWGGELLMAPKRVMCATCGAEFETFQEDKEASDGE
jgi:hypothetical protein